MSQRLLILLSLVLGALLGGIIWVLGLPATSGQYTLDRDSLPLVRATLDRDKRLEAIELCLPKQLTIKNKDTSDRINRALTEMGNDQLERILKLSNNPKLSEAELEFENCLQAKGIEPQRINPNLLTP